MKPYILFLLFIVASGLLVSVLFSSNAQAECRCEELQSIENEFSSSDIVISGRVEKVTKSPFKEGHLKVVVKPFRKLKGESEMPGSRVTIYTPESDSDCGYGFAPSNDYLIYASGSPAFYHTTKCSRTSYLETAFKEVTALTKLSKKKTESK